MLTETNYKEIYSQIYHDCPTEIWAEFVQDLLTESKKYRKLIESKKINVENDTERKLLSEIESAISIRKLSEYTKTPIKEYNNLINKKSIPPIPKEISSRIRTLPGGATAKKRKALKLKNIDKKKLNVEYNNGISLNQLAKKYDTHIENIKELIDSEIRISDNELNQKTIQLLESKPNKWYYDLLINNKNWSLEDLKSYVIKNLLKEEYSSKAIIPYFYSIGIEIDEDRKNRARKIKSKNNNNLSWLVKKLSIEYIEKSHFKTVDNLTKEYCTNTIGTYQKIADDLNNELSIDHFNGRQIEKLITNNKFYERKRSRVEKIFIETVKNIFNLKQKNVDYFEEYIVSKDSKSTVDLYIPDKKLAFEFNGDYWHSNEVINYNYGITAKEFHMNKKELCKTVGIQLLFVWERDFDEKYDSIIEKITIGEYDSPILNKLEYENDRRTYKSPSNRARKILKDLGFKNLRKKHNDFFDCGDLLVKDYSKTLNNHSFVKKARELDKELFTIYPWHDYEKVKEFLDYRINKKSKKIFARKCTIESKNFITPEDRNFIENNHILGKVNIKNLISVEKILFDDELLGMAVFIRIDEETAELKRLVFLKGYSVVGGASRLLKNFVRNNQNISSIITFSDNNLSEGKIYSKLGFNLLRESKGDKIWYNSKTGQKFTDQSLYKIGADRLLKNVKGYTPYGIGEDLPSNTEIVEKWGFVKVIDCGYKKWSYSIKN